MVAFSRSQHHAAKRLPLGGEVDDQTSRCIPLPLPPLPRRLWKVTRLFVGENERPVPPKVTRSIGTPVPVEEEEAARALLFPLFLSTHTLPLRTTRATTTSRAHSSAETNGEPNHDPFSAEAGRTGNAPPHTPTSYHRGSSQIACVGTPGRERAPSPQTEPVAPRPEDQRATGLAAFVALVEAPARPPGGSRQDRTSTGCECPRRPSTLS